MKNDVLQTMYAEMPTENTAKVLLFIEESGFWRRVATFAINMYNKLKKSAGIRGILKVLLFIGEFDNFYGKTLVFNESRDLGPLGTTKKSKVLLFIEEMSGKENCLMIISTLMSFFVFFSHKILNVPKKFINSCRDLGSKNIFCINNGGYIYILITTHLDYLNPFLAPPYYNYFYISIIYKYTLSLKNFMGKDAISLGKRNCKFTKLLRYFWGGLYNHGKGVLKGAQVPLFIGKSSIGNFCSGTGLVSPSF